MAIYSMSVSNVKSSAGAKFDYISREGKFNKRQEEDLLFCGSKNLPTWAESGRDFWKVCDEFEGERKAKQIILALPNELDIQSNIEIIESLMSELTKDKNAYSFAIHRNKGKLSEIDNTHAHIIFTERSKDNTREEPNRETYFKKGRTRKDGTISGGFKKNPEFKQKDWIYKAREKTSEVINQKLKEKGIDERVTHKSFKDLGIDDRQPQIHVGNSKEKQRQNEKIKKRNQEIAKTQKIVGEKQREVERTKSHLTKLKAEKEDIKKEIEEMKIPNPLEAVTRNLNQMLENQKRERERVKRLREYQEASKKSIAEYKQRKIDSVNEMKLEVKEIESEKNKIRQPLENKKLELENLKSEINQIKDDWYKQPKLKEKIQEVEKEYQYNLKNIEPLKRNYEAFKKCEKDFFEGTRPKWQIADNYASQALNMTRYEAQQKANDYGIGFRGHLKMSAPKLEGIAKEFTKITENAKSISRDFSKTRGIAQKSIGQAQKIHEGIKRAIDDSWPER